jgi:hypothetical protein
MIDWPIIIFGGLAVVVFFALLKLVRSILRLVVAFIGAALVTGLAYGIVQWMGLAEVVPNAVFLLIGALAALFLLIKH